MRANKKTPKRAGPKSSETWPLTDRSGEDHRTVQVVALLGEGYRERHRLSAPAQATREPARLKVRAGDVVEGARDAPAAP